MKVRSIKFKVTMAISLLVIFSVVSIIFMAIFLGNLSINSESILSISASGENPYVYNQILIKSIIFLLLWLAVIWVVSFIISQKITKPAFALLQGIKAIENGDLDFRISMQSADEIGQLAEGINLMSLSLQNSFSEFEKQKKELFDKNWALQEANMELEASYEQLQATIEQLDEAENKYHTLIRNIPEVVCVINNTGEIVFVNHKVKDVLGYEKGELIGQNALRSVDAETPVDLLNTITRELKDKHSVSFELSLVKKDGTKIIVEATATEYLYKGCVLGLQIIARDITSRKEMEKQILQRNKELAVLNHLSRSLNSTIELDEVLSTIVEEISFVIDAPLCMVSLLEDNLLKVKAFIGSFFGDDFKLSYFPAINIYEDEIGKVIIDAKMLYTDKIEEKWIIHDLNQLKPETEKIKNMILIPLINKNQKIGVITVGVYHHMTESDISLLWSIANNASIAIDNAILYDNSKRYFIKTIDALIAAIEAKDRYTEGHSQRVARYAVEIANHLSLSKEQIEDLKISGILHDIGKIGVSDSILLKQGALTDLEYEQVKQHPVISKKILYPVGLSERIINTIAYHHERYDGKGYPTGVVGRELPIEVQIITVADAFDAMTSNRSYRKALSLDFAVSELLKNKGTQFSPVVVDIMVELFTKKKESIIKIMNDTGEIAS